MKKAIKKLMAVLLAAAMLCAMAVPAFADEAAAATFKITAPATSHQYEIYQIFTGDYSTSKGTLSNIKWGTNGTGETGTAVDQAVLKELSDVTDGSDAEKLEVVEKYAALTSPVATISNGNSYTAAAGYYLIKDKDGSVTGTDTYTTYIVRVVGDLTITPKSDAVPTFEKKLKDTNDTTGEVSGWQDSADYDIGDRIPFQLKGTVPSNYDAYKSYYFAFHDQEEKGLTFDADSVKVYCDSAALSASDYKVITNTTDGCSFEIIFDDLKAISAVKAGSVITAEYESVLNSDAVLGKKGNVNTAKLEFSNNPHGTGTGDTPWDSVIVFTYRVKVNKVDQNDQPLTGAEFTLSKQLPGNTTKDIAVVKSDDGTSFTFSGLDDGTYTLTETKTPDGYNTIEPITFTVTAEHNVVWETVERTDILTSLTGNVATGDITFTADENKAELSTNVVNKAGTTLPSTGGIGTTIFYVVGGGLMIAAAVLLITKKRMENK